MKNILEMARKAHVVPYIVGPTNDEYLARIAAFADLVKATHVDELLAGVEMPEPFPAGYIAKSEYFHTDKTLRETVAAAVLRKDAEIADLSDALHRIDCMAVSLPTFAIKHEGGASAAAQNIVDAMDTLKAENERLRDDAQAWRDYQERKRRAIEAGMGRNAMRDAAMKGQP